MSHILTGTSEILGTKDSLPHDIAEMAILTNEVIAWTALDPQLAPDVKLFFCSHYWPSLCAFVVCPLSWPFLVISLPIICDSKARLEHSIRSQYWILTETDLKVVTKSHDKCCIPGCCESGHSVVSIPLECITNCGTKEYGNGSTHCFCKLLPILFIDTAGHSLFTQGVHVEGYGLANRAWFAREVLKRRDIVKGIVVPNHAFAEAVVEAPVMERGTTAKSAADRIKDVTDLRTSGILTQEEYDKKRQEIIDSI